MVVQFAGPQNLGEEIKRKPLIQRRTYDGVCLDRLIAFQPVDDVVIAVSSELDRGRRSADLTIVQKDSCPVRYARETGCASHTTYGDQERRRQGEAGDPSGNSYFKP